MIYLEISWIMLLVLITLKWFFHALKAMIACKIEICLV